MARGILELRDYSILTDLPFYMNKMDGERLEKPSLSPHRQNAIQGGKSQS